MTAVAILLRWEELFFMKNEHGASFLHQYWWWGGEMVVSWQRPKSS
jgi:hypothetical protein